MEIEGLSTRRYTTFSIRCELGAIYYYMRRSKKARIEYDRSVKAAAGWLLATHVQLKRLLYVYQYSISNGHNVVGMYIGATGHDYHQVKRLL